VRGSGHRNEGIVIYAGESNGKTRQIEYRRDKSRENRNGTQEGVKKKKGVKFMKPHVKHDNEIGNPVRNHPHPHNKMRAVDRSGKDRVIE
jgi:hypothetical protein